MTRMPHSLVVLVPAIFCWAAPDALAHRCTQEWNCVSIQAVVLTNATILEVAAALNAEIRRASTNKVKQAMAVDASATTFVKCSDHTEDQKSMDILIQRYKDFISDMRMKGVPELESLQVQGVLSLRSPGLACALCALACRLGTGYDETPAGAVFRRDPVSLECRVYPLDEDLERLARQAGVSFLEVLSEDPTAEFDIECIFSPCPSSYIKEHGRQAKQEWLKQCRETFLMYRPDRGTVLVLATRFMHGRIQKELDLRKHRLDAPARSEVEGKPQPPAAGTPSDVADPFGATRQP